MVRIRLNNPALGRARDNSVKNLTLRLPTVAEPDNDDTTKYRKIEKSIFGANF